MRDGVEATRGSGTGEEIGDATISIGVAVTETFAIGSGAGGVALGSAGGGVGVVTCSLIGEMDGCGLELPAEKCEITVPISAFLKLFHGFFRIK